MYPIDLPWWFSLLAVIVLTVFAAWVFVKDASPSPVGLMGVVVAGITSMAWFTNLPIWTVFLVVIATIGLFGIGMIRPAEKDDPWHFAAFIVGLGGKAFCALIPWLIEQMSGNMEVPKWVLFTFALVVIPSLVALLFAWPSLMNRFGRKHKAASPLPTPLAPVRPAESDNKSVSFGLDEDEEKT